MLHEGGLEPAFDHRRSRRPGRLHVPALQIALRQDVVRLCRVDGRGARRARRLDADQRRLHRPCDRQVGVAQRLHGFPGADQRRDRLAAEPHPALGQHRLVARVRKDAEAVRAGHVAMGQDRRQPGRRGNDRAEIAQRERRARMGRADDAHVEGAIGRLVGAEPVGARDLGPAIDAGDARADEGVRPLRLRSSG